MTSLILYKLSDGAEVMARLIDADNTSFVLVERARTVVFQQDASNNTRVAFPPWSLVAGDSLIEINRNHIVSTLTAIPKALEDAYLTQTSGIALA